MARNEFGEQLDRNGYAKSLLNGQSKCYFCKSGGNLVRHEVFHGAYRGKAKMYGCWLLLCPNCHFKLHNSDGEMDRQLKKFMQGLAMVRYKWNTDKFISVFGKNYI